MYQVDAFADQIFKGNPAAVIPLNSWLTTEVMQQVAAENNLAETAFFVQEESGTFLIRWFTPLREVELCGHATLASAHVLYEHLDYELDHCTFNTQKRGKLHIRKTEDGLMMNFPADYGMVVTEQEKQSLANRLHLKLIDVRRGLDDYLMIIEDEKMVREYTPDFRAITEIDARGIILSASAKPPFDFVSRCFFPKYGIEEDPVTGSAHTLLTPYWSEKKGKKKMIALQASKRTGEVICVLDDQRVFLGGQATTFLIGEIFL